ncbi:MAG: hypothetical protein NF693_09175 [Bombella sp.]|nr:hypothetical protein [Bombella sp.]
MPNSDGAKLQCDHANKQEKQEKIDLEFLQLALKPSWKNTEKTEQPDFIIEDHDGSKFGLELTNIFQGDDNRKGSKAHQKEKTNANSLQKIRKECVELFPFCSEYSLDWGVEPFNEEKAIDLIKSIMNYIKNNCDVKIKSRHFLVKDYKIDECDENINGMHEGIQDFVHVKHDKYNPIWRVLADHLPLENKANREIQNCIDKKSKKLSSYKNKTNKVKLLISSYSFLHTSQSIYPDENFFPDLKGFDIVYFSYSPYGVIEYNSSKEKKIYSALNGEVTSQKFVDK